MFSVKGLGSLGCLGNVGFYTSFGIEMLPKSLFEKLMFQALRLQKHLADLSPKP